MTFGEVHCEKRRGQASEFLLRRILRASGVWMKTTMRALECVLHSPGVQRVRLVAILNLASHDTEITVSGARVKAVLFDEALQCCGVSVAGNLCLEWVLVQHRLHSQSHGGHCAERKKVKNRDHAASFLLCSAVRRTAPPLPCSSCGSLPANFSWCLTID